MTRVPRLTPEPDVAGYRFLTTRSERIDLATRNLFHAYVQFSGMVDRQDIRRTILEHARKAITANYDLPIRCGYARGSMARGSMVGNAARTLGVVLENTLEVSAIPLLGETLIGSVERSLNDVIAETATMSTIGELVSHGS